MPAQFPGSCGGVIHVFGIRHQGRGPWARRGVSPRRNSPHGEDSPNACRKTREERLEEATPIFAQIMAFNGEHSHATWREIEATVHRALSGLRRDLIADSVQGHALTDFRRAADRPTFAFTSRCTFWPLSWARQNDEAI